MRPRFTLAAIALLSFIVHAVVLLLLPDDGIVVEAVYVGGLYPVLAPVVSFIPSLLPFSVTTVGTVAVLIWALAYLALNIRRWLTRRMRFTQAVARTFVAWGIVAIGLFHSFYLFWGYHYLRVPLEERLALTAVDTSDEARAATSRLMVERAVRAITETEPWDRQELDRLIDLAIDQAMRELEGRPAPVTSPLKGDLARAYLSLFGQSGFLNPFTLEPHVDTGMPSFQVAFTAAHEKAHLVGYARERDANFMAWYALTRSDDPRLQFAGHFGVARYFRNAATAEIFEPLIPYYRMVAEYSAAHASPALRSANRRVYSVYMRANRMDAGLDDYGEVASLIHSWLLQEPGTTTR
jgi:hypothetical protein